MVHTKMPKDLISKFYFQKTIKIHPQNIKAHQNLMESYENLNKEKDLIQAIKDAKKLIGDNSVIRLYESIILYNSNRFVEAKNLLEKISLYASLKPKISLFSYNPVAKGFLTGKYTRDTENEGIRFKSDPGFKPKFFKSQDYDVLETVVKLASEKDVKPVQIALAWSLKKDITLPIIGVTKKIHVEEAVESLNVKLTDDDICLLYTSPSPRDGLLSRMPSSA